MRRLTLLALLVASLLPGAHLLYVAEPGIRNYEEYGGVGLLVFDIDQDYKFVRRIPTWTVPPLDKSPKTSRVSPRVPKRGASTSPASTA